MLHLQGDYCKILESQWPPQLPVYGTHKYYPLFFHQKTVRLSYPWKRDTSVVLSQYTSQEENCLLLREYNNSGSSLFSAVDRYKIIWNLKTIIDICFLSMLRLSGWSCSSIFYKQCVLGQFVQHPNDKFFYKVFFIGDGWQLFYPEWTFYKVYLTYKKCLYSIFKDKVFFIGYSWQLFDSEWTFLFCSLFTNTVAIATLTE